MQLSSLARRVHGPLLHSLIVMCGYILSRVTGLVREIAIAAQFGTSAEIGAYRAAFKITDLLYMVIIGGALGSSFIPVFIQVWERDGSARAWKLSSAVVTWSLAVLALASAVLWVLAPQLTAWFYGGFDPQSLALTTALTRLFLLSPLLLGLGGLAMAALNARGHFTLPALAPAMYNLGIIAGAVLLAPHWGIWGLAWGVIIGAGCYLLIQLPGLWNLGMRLHIAFEHRMAELRTIAHQMVPRVLGQSAAQMSILVTAALTAYLAFAEERIAGLDYAYQLMLLPYGIFSLSLSTVAFPHLARLFAEQQYAELESSVRRTLSTILLLTLPATVALVTLAVPLVRLVYQYGAFDQTSLLYTVVPLMGYATALPAFAASEILIRTFYAMQETRIPVLVGLLQVTLNLGLGSFALMQGYGVGALTLAFSIANNVEMVLLLVLLSRSRPHLWRDPELWRSARATGLASLAVGLLLWAAQRLSLPYLPFLGLNGTYDWRTDFLALVMWLVGAGLAGGGLYGSLVVGLGASQARVVWTRIRRRIGGGQG